MIRVLKYLGKISRLAHGEHRRRARLCRHSRRDGNYRRLFGVADLAVDRIGGRCRLAVRHVSGRIAVALRVRQKLSEQNMRLDGALNNMIQGLCMFDAQNRLMVWNERYRAMYNIDPRRIWRGCTIRDLLDARIAAGTFPLDPARYDARTARGAQAGQNLHAQHRIEGWPHHRRRQSADQRRRLGGDARRYHRAQAGRARAGTYPLVPRHDHRERAFADHREGHSEPALFADQSRRREISRRRSRNDARQDRVPTSCRTTSAETIEARRSED